MSDGAWFFIGMISLWYSMSGTVVIAAFLAHSLGQR
jgi:hypothetical protein